MRTPNGTECKFFYANYFRGRNHEECRLIGVKQPPNNWEPKLCSTCPVPRILVANACPNMVLKGNVKRSLLGIRKFVEVSAYCTKTNQIVIEPEIGCGECHDIDILMGPD